MLYYVIICHSLIDRFTHILPFLNIHDLGTYHYTFVTEINNGDRSMMSLSYSLITSDRYEQLFCLKIMEDEMISS